MTNTATEPAFAYFLEAMKEIFVAFALGAAAASLIAAS